MIDNTVVSLSEQVGGVDLKKRAKQLASDLRALILVYKSPEAVPPNMLVGTLNQLQTIVEAEIDKNKVKGVYFNFFTLSVSLNLEQKCNI